VITLILSWPVESSLNSRLHWAKRAEINSANVLEGRLAALQAHPDILPAGYYSASIMFHPPDHRRRDLDNMLARIKKQLDSACLVWLIDDSCIRRITLEWGAVEKPGRVVVTITKLV
jgi:hypothetical protein